MSDLKQLRNDLFLNNISIYLASNGKAKIRDPDKNMTDDLRTRMQEFKEDLISLSQDKCPVCKKDLQAKLVNDIVLHLCIDGHYSEEMDLTELADTKYVLTFNSPAFSQPLYATGNLVVKRYGLQFSASELRDTLGYYRSITFNNLLTIINMKRILRGKVDFYGLNDDQHETTFKVAEES